MKRYLTIVQSLAVVMVIAGTATIAFADTGCFLWVFKAGGEEYMEYRPGYPQCHYQQCIPATDQCKVRTINVGGQMGQYCGCKPIHAGDGCFLGYSGTEPTGGSAYCINLCPSPQVCPPVSWVPSSWDPSIQVATACGACQAPPP